MTGTGANSLLCSASWTDVFSLGQHDTVRQDDPLELRFGLDVDPHFWTSFDSLIWFVWFTVYEFEVRRSHFQFQGNHAELPGAGSRALWLGVALDTAGRATTSGRLGVFCFSARIWFRRGSAVEGVFIPNEFAVTPRDHHFAVEFGGTDLGGTEARLIGGAGRPPDLVGAALSVAWASRVVGTTAPTLTGAPSGVTSPLTSEVRLSGFGTSSSYDRLADLLDARLVGHPEPVGQPVTEAMLSEADVIAFEANGNEPVPTGGWESSRWTFDDGMQRVTVDWDELPGVHSPAEVIATGSIDGSRYRAFFDIPDGGADDPVISYLLFRLPTSLDTLSEQFTLTIAPWPGHGGGQPDPDAIGVVRRR